MVTLLLCGLKKSTHPILNVIAVFFPKLQRVFYLLYLTYLELILVICKYTGYSIKNSRYIEFTNEIMGKCCWDPQITF